MEAIICDDCGEIHTGEDGERAFALDQCIFCGSEGSLEVTET